MSTIQEIFNTVIEHYYYDPEGGGENFMCHALDHAYNDGIITEWQRIMAEESINEYLNHLGGKKSSLLTSALKRNKMPHEPKDLVAIYSNWENRPILHLNGFKVGDKVHCLLYGVGRVIHLSPGSKNPVQVKFLEGHINTLNYTKEGRILHQHKVATLFKGVKPYLAFKKKKTYKNINGFKVPDIPCEPEEGEEYFVPNASQADYCHRFRLKYPPHRSFNVKRGLVYPLTKEGRKAAAAHGKAFLGIGEPYETK